MKFTCNNKFNEKLKNRENWHKWFAWYPVKVGEHDCRWLESVNRRFKIYVNIGGIFEDVEYIP